MRPYKASSKYYRAINFKTVITTTLSSGNQIL